MLPGSLDPRGFGALRDDPAAWQAEMQALLQAQGWQGPWRAAGEGTVKEIRVQPGQAVNPGDVLMVIE